MSARGYAVITMTEYRVRHTEKEEERVLGTVEFGVCGITETSNYQYYGWY